MLDEILASINNYFPAQKLSGKYKISGGRLEEPAPAFLKQGQYFRVIGSTFNDGVYQYPATDLTDEEFFGQIWPLAIPKQLLELSQEVEKYKAEHPETGFDSESFGGYSYHRAAGKDGSPATWRDVYRTQLNRWRRV